MLIEFSAMNVCKIANRRSAVVCYRTVLHNAFVVVL